MQKVNATITFANNVGEAIKWKAADDGIKAILNESRVPWNGPRNNARSEVVGEAKGFFFFPVRFNKLARRFWPVSAGEKR